MASNWDERTSKGAWVDHTTLRGAPSGTQTRYTVSLRGLVDGRWIEALRLTQTGSNLYRAFRHDGGSGTVAFSCRTVDGAGEVFEALDLLETLIASVNEQVETWRADGTVQAFAPGPRGVV